MATVRLTAKNAEVAEAIRVYIKNLICILS